VHLVGACGTGMAALACLLRDLGVEVSGSDAGVYPPMSDVLDRLGVRLREGYSPENLDPAPDLVVIGNAISRGNPEAELVLDAGLPYASLPEALAGLFLAGRRVMAVAGTHGKTTTASMLAFLLDRAGRSPSFFVGGQPRDLPAPARLGSGEDFVVEADEYDSAFFDKEPKFLHYRPRVVVVGSVEYDHADIYPDVESIVLRFRRLLRGVPRAGRVLLGADDARARSLAEHAYSPVETFGFGPDADWRAEDLEETGEGAKFVLRGPGGVGPLPARLRVSGTFNVRNAVAAVAAASAAGVPASESIAMLCEFSGVQRRLQLRDDVAGVRLYDDFAHHPTAVAGALRALRGREHGRRLVAVLEPRSNTMRRRVFQGDLAEALAGADEVLLAPVHRAEGVAEDDRLDPSALARELCERGVEARAFASTAEIVEALSTSLRQGDSVLVMSNGAFDDLHRRVADRLKARAS
jgi:UDP-N-acetylmuramate: L-alanyl-gamma-D-glutamyl-meso-diaminopimelate ligase